MKRTYSSRASASNPTAARGLNGLSTSAHNAVRRYAVMDAVHRMGARANMAGYQAGTVKAYIRNKPKKKKRR